MEVKCVCRQAEAAAICTETGVAEHDVLLTNLNRAIHVLVKMCATKVIEYLGSGW